MSCPRFQAGFALHAPLPRLWGRRSPGAEPSLPIRISRAGSGGMEIILAGAGPGKEWDGVSWKTRGEEGAMGTWLPSGEGGIGIRSQTAPGCGAEASFLGFKTERMREESWAGKFEIHLIMRAAEGSQGSRGIPGILYPPRKRDLRDPRVPPRGKP